MTCATLERLVQALSTSRCFVSNFETGHILTERCDCLGGWWGQRLHSSLLRGWDPCRAELAPLPCPKPGKLGSTAPGGWRVRRAELAPLPCRKPGKPGSTAPGGWDPV